MQERIRGMRLCLVVGVIGSMSATAQQASPPASVAPTAGNDGGGKTVTTPLYTVQDGNKVDEKTLMGWKTWRALACERCHGASQEGLVGPSLVERLKILTKDQFHTTVMQGRVTKGMPNFDGSQMVVQNWENLYAYLKGRSDGNIQPGHLYAITQSTATAPQSSHPR